MSQNRILTPDQRLRVFVSSTLQEVAEERKAAREAIARLRLTPVMFELGARPHPPRDLYRAYLEQSHIFIGIYWERYGWVAPGETISGLEDEFRLAGDRPKLIYIKSPAPDREARLKELLDDVKSASSYKYFTTAAELADLIENDLIVLLTERFEPGANGGTTAGTPSTLPLALSHLVGRTNELDAVKQLLTKARIVTITGAGGTGKTRLALQVATDLLEEYDGGVYFVDLSSSRDTDTALTTIARTIGVTDHGEDGHIEDIKPTIGARKMLLLLDNFEQVTGAAGAMTDVLQDCPGLKLLITSREALHVRGEYLFPLAPLSLPDQEAKRASVADLERSEAVQLFVERAQAANPGFQLREENAGAIAETCVRLDGLPLAIELAAARLNLFTPQGLVERLDNRMALLRGGARDLPARQQTLSDTIDWSYQLLDAGEQRLLQVLSVFSDVTLEAVEAVLGSIGSTHEAGIDIYDGMSSLVDKNLIRQVDAFGGAPRFAMLGTIREFVTAQLEDDAAFCAAARRAHATYFAHLMQHRWKSMTEDGAGATWVQVAADIENAQIAWLYWLAEQNLEELRKLSEGLWAFYHAHGWFLAMRDLATGLLSILSSTRSTPEQLRDEVELRTNLARVLFALHGYTPEVESAYMRAKELCDEAAALTQSYPILRGLATFYMYRAEFEKAAEIGEQMLSLAERLDDPAARLEGCLMLGACLAMGSGASVRAGLEYLDQGLAAYRNMPGGSHTIRLGNDPGVVCRAVSGLVSWMLGFPEKALSHLDESIDLARRINHPQSMAYALFHSGLLALWLREDELAEARAQAVLAIAEEHDFPVWTAVALCIRGTALAGMGSADEGLRMIQQGVTAYGGLHAPPVFGPSLLYVQAKACSVAGRAEEGLQRIEEALAIAAQGTPRALTSEYLQLKGDLILALSADNAADAEALFAEGRDIAAGAEVWMLHLRAAIRLGRLWLGQGKREEARTLLTTALARLTEGQSNADVREATALREEAAAG